jgi:hypothetical protein
LSSFVFEDPPRVGHGILKAYAKCISLNLKWKYNLFFHSKRKREKKIKGKKMKRWRNTHTYSMLLMVLIRRHLCISSNVWYALR